MNDALLALRGVLLVVVALGAIFVADTLLIWSGWDGRILP